MGSSVQKKRVKTTEPKSKNSGGKGNNQSLRKTSPDSNSNSNSETSKLDDYELRIILDLF